MDFSTVSSWIVFGVLFIVCMLLVYILGFFKGKSGSAQKQAVKPKRGLISNSIRLLFILALFATFLALIFYSALIRSYHSFTGKELVAITYTESVQDPNYDFKLTVIPIIKSMIQDTLTYLLNGDQWAISGNILKWKNWMNFLGVKTMYRLTRVHGRYLNTEKEKAEPPTVYPLYEEQKGKVWQWLFKYGQKLPVIESVYGNEAYTKPYVPSSFKVFVTTSGFMITREQR